MNFTKLNEKMNYYSKVSKQTGVNNWNQDAIQNDFIEMIQEVNLTNSQIEQISNLMVSNNAVLDMEPSKNMSAINVVKKLNKVEVNNMVRSKAA